MKHTWKYRGRSLLVGGHHPVRGLWAAQIEVVTLTWWRHAMVTAWLGRTAPPQRWTWRWNGRNETPEEGWRRAEETIKEIDARLGPRTREVAPPPC